MKILHVSPSFARRDGGPSEVLRGLLPALERLGIDWRLVTTDKGLAESDQEFARNERVYVASSGLLKRWTFSFGILRLLAREISQSDAVHIHSVHTFPSTAAMLFARVYRKPYLLEPHGALDTYHLAQGAFKKRMYSRVVDGRSLRTLRGVIYSSQMELLQGQLFLPRIPAFLMNLGVSADLLVAERKPKQVGSTIVFLGRVTPKKRLDLLIRALAADPLKDAEARLIVAGPLDPQLDYSPVGLAEELGVSHRVDFLGQVDSQERRRLLTEATVFSLPSEDESFGIAVAEALAAGCPVVASDRVGIAPEAARAGALLIAELAPMDLANKLRQILDSSTLQRQLSTAGRNYASEEFTWEMSARQAVGIYSSAVNSSKG